jgi:hypothetical protein
MIGVDTCVDAGGAVPMCTGHSLSGRRSGSSAISNRLDDGGTSARRTARTALSPSLSGLVRVCVRVA